ncbi:MAG: hypothetical protein WBP45_02205 [Daejeonella sp.]
MQYHYSNEEEINKLITEFTNQILPIERWTHEAHLIVALWFLNRYTMEEAACYLRSGIISYNTHVGTENSPVKGYHETMTLFWIKVIDNYLKINKAENLLTTCNNFLNSPFSSRDYPLKFYSRELIFSTKARAFWTEPDLEKLPG